MIEADTTQVDSFADHLQRVLERDVPRGMTEAMNRTLDNIMSVMDYPPPPESEANQPPPPWYERGAGTHYKNAFVPNPEAPMSARWVRSVRRSGNAVEGELENVASYSSYVLGIPGREQASFHTAREWPSLLGEAITQAGGLPGEVGITYQGRAIRESEFEATARRIARLIENVKV